jgi:hypothetical protein
MPRQLGRGGKADIAFLLTYFYAWLTSDNVLEVARIMNVRRQNLNEWPRKYRNFAIAKEMADKLRAQGKKSTMVDYIYKRLSNETKELWDELQWKNKLSREDLEAYLAPRNKRVRQELFLHSLTANGFDVSTACHQTGISFARLRDWEMHDPEFKALMDEMIKHRNNFFEKQLYTLVEIGNPAAVIFVNETINADRGYSRKMKIEHSGQVNTGLGIDDLDLDVDTKRKILEAIRQKQALAQAKPVKQLGEGSVDTINEVQ